MTLLDNMPHTARHERLRFIRPTGEMGMRSTPVVVETGINVWVQNASHSEVVEFQKKDQVVTHRISRAAKWSARSKDEIVITAGPAGDPFVGERFIFKAVAERTAGFGLAYTIYAEIENNVREDFQGTSPPLLGEGIVYEEQTVVVPINPVIDCPDDA